MLAHSFEFVMLGKLVLNGLAKVETHNTMAGSRRMKVVWMQISRAGRQAIAEIARRVEARRPHGNRGLAGCYGQDAAANAALSGKPDPVGKFPGAVIVAAGQHHRIDAPSAFGLDDRVAGRGIAAELGETPLRTMSSRQIESRF
jgi:hypothetical protein